MKNIPGHVHSWVRWSVVPPGDQREATAWCGHLPPMKTRHWFFLVPIIYSQYSFGRDRKGLLRSKINYGQIPAMADRLTYWWEVWPDREETYRQSDRSESKEKERNTERLTINRAIDGRSSSVCLSDHPASHKADISRPGQWRDLLLFETRDINKILISLPWGCSTMCCLLNYWTTLWDSSAVVCCCPSLLMSSMTLLSWLSSPLLVQSYKEGFAYLFT